MRTHLLAWLSFATAAGLVASGCGGSSGNDCGPGTVEMDGECVPTSELECGEGTVMMAGKCVPEDETVDELECGEGTVMMGGECVPDGSVVCTGATVFDPETGTCVLDEGACAEGTVLQDGECVPFDDTLVGDVEEGDEPNGIEPGTAPEATMFTLPEAGADAVSMRGCIQPDDFDGDEKTDADFDGYEFSVSGPTLINVRIDGIGGLSGAFQLFGRDEDLLQDGWVRIGADLSSDSAERQIFLPKGGDYLLLAADSRALFFQEPAGGEETCYYMEVSQLEMPDPTELTLGELEEGNLGDPQFFTTTSTENQLLVSELSEDSDAATGALVQLVDGTYVGSASVADGSATLNAPALPDGGEVLIVADHVFNISLDDVPYELRVNDAQAQMLPEDGDVTFTHSPDVAASAYFEGEAGDVVRIEFDGSPDEIENMDVIDPDGASVGAHPCTILTFLGPFPVPCSEGDFWVQLTTSGMHYLTFENIDADDGAEYTVSFTRTHETPVELTLGETESGALDTADRTFFTFNTGSVDWAEFLLDNFGGDLTTADMRVYFRELPGVLDVNVENLGALGGLLADGDSVETIYAGLNVELLVSIGDDETHEETETFDLTFRDADYIDLGTLDESMPVDRMDDTIEADGSVRYLAKGEQGTLFSAMASLPEGAEEALTVETLNLLLDPTDSAADGEALDTYVDSAGWMAYRVTEDSGETVDFDFSIDVTDPPYTVDRGSADAFDNVCPGVGGGGELHALADGDEGLSTMPYSFSGFSFAHFGEDVDGFVVSSNGWLTFDTEYEGDALFSPEDMGTADDPNALVAPFWIDIDEAFVCIEESADTLAVQWAGRLWQSAGTGPYVQFQTVLHSDGQVDVIYGPGHQVPGVSPAAVIGLENADGSNGLSASAPVEPLERIVFTPADSE